MKKLPLFLSTAMVATTSLGVLAPVVLANDGGVRDNLLEAGVLQGTRSLALAESVLYPDRLYTDTNHMIKELMPTLIDQKSNEIYLQDVMAGDWRPQWLTIGWMDYENGVTEAQADAGLERLGTQDCKDWAVIYSDGEITQTSLSGYAKRTNKAVKLADNKSDMLYYAVRWAREVRGEDGTVVLEDDHWVRGKIDYRRCVHSDVYKKEVTRCRQIKAATDATYGFEVQENSGSYRVIPYSEGEVVMTWDEEWRKILTERSKEYSDKMAALVEFLSKPDEFLDNVDAVVMKMLKVLPGMEDMSRVLTETQGTERNAKLARELYKKLLDEGDDNTQVLQQMITQLEAQKAALEVTKTELETDKAGLEGELSEAKALAEQLSVQKNRLEERIRELEEAGDGNGSDLEKLKELEGQIEILSQEKANLAGEVARERKARQQSEAQLGVKEEARMALEKENLHLREELSSMKASMESCDKKSDVVDNESVKIENQEGMKGNGYTNGATQGVSKVDEAKEEKLSKDMKENGLRGEENNESGDESDVNVPVLGGSEEMGRGLWWWLVPVVVMAGSAIFWLKRALGRK